MAVFKVGHEGELVEQIAGLTDSNKFRFDHTSQSWLLWRNVPGYWRPSEKSEIRVGIEIMLRALSSKFPKTKTPPGWDPPGCLIFNKAGDVIGKSHERQLQLWQQFHASWLKPHTIEVVEKTMRHTPPFPVLSSEFNLNTDIFVCNNGVLDLITGEFRTGRPSDMATIKANVDYDPDATCPLFRHTVETSLPDVDKQRVLQEVLGSCISGRTYDRSTLLVGKAAAGKTSIARAVAYPLGGYYKPIDSKVLNTHRFGSDNNVTFATAGLPGVRMGIVAELEGGIDGSILKQWSGGDDMVGRHPCGRPFHFRSQFKLIFYTNTDPAMSADPGVRRRIVKIDFLRSFENDPDCIPDLEDKLKLEASGILNWLIEGHNRLRDAKYKLYLPESIQASVNEYMDSEDLVLGFTKECLFVADNANTPSRRIYDVYVSWCESRHQKNPMSSISFSKNMKRLGHYSKEHGHKNIWSYEKLAVNDAWNVEDIGSDFKPRSGI